MFSVSQRRWTNVVLGETWWGSWVRTSWGLKDSLRRFGYKSLPCPTKVYRNVGSRLIRSWGFGTLPGFPVINILSLTTSRLTSVPQGHVGILQWIPPPHRCSSTPQGHVDILRWIPPPHRCSSYRCSSTPSTLSTYILTVFGRTKYLHIELNIGILKISESDNRR